MPKTKNSTYVFYDAQGKHYPFWAPDAETAIKWALEWSRPRRIKLYRKKGGP